jgi:hypothetical protein
MLDAYCDSAQLHALALLALLLDTEPGDVVAHRGTTNVRRVAHRYLAIRVQLLPGARTPLPDDALDFLLPLG